MGGFFRSFLAALLALTVFAVVAVLILLAIVSGLTSSKIPEVGEKAVLFIDLNLSFKEQKEENALAGLGSVDH
ncbi:MAG TPA: hypothetical protein VK563_21025, partial [Puia sp.]|nr:hypothetical protein [Puia sp.]